MRMYKDVDTGKRPSVLVFSSPCHQSDHAINRLIDCCPKVMSKVSETGCLHKCGGRFRMCRKQKLVRDVWHSIFSAYTAWDFT